MRKNVARRARGFTLLEMMLVVVIMGILATVVIVSFGGRTTAARIQATRSKMATLKSMLYQYQGTYATFPATLDLLTLGAAKFIEKVPKDGWNKDFDYTFPSPSNNPEQPFELKSRGIDGQPGTPDDIDVWTMDNTP